MLNVRSIFTQTSVVASMLMLAAPAYASFVQVTINVENLAPANSVSFAPLRFGFNNGTFDAFNQGEVATAPIISVAEGGSGSAWLPAFAAADPTAVIGSTMGGAVLPGATRSASFLINTSLNPFFTFASMVVPSNDFFIGNDSPTEYRLFDMTGSLLINSISLTASDIWNAGSEAFDPLNAAFLVGGNNSLRTPENGVVGFNFSELAGFNGLTTAAGYVFDSALTADTDIFRISFTVKTVPEPVTVALMTAGLLGMGLIVRGRRQGARAPLFETAL